MLKKHQFRLFVGSTMKLSLCAVSHPVSTSHNKWFLHTPAPGLDTVGQRYQVEQLQPAPYIFQTGN